MKNVGRGSELNGFPMKLNYGLTFKKINYIIMNVQLEEYPSPAEGIGLENRQELNGSRGFESLFLRFINGPVV